MISQWISEEEHSRGHLYMIMRNMDIIIDDAQMAQLVSEYEDEEDEMAKWAYSILIMNNHKQAEEFYHLHCEERTESLSEDFQDQIGNLRPYFTMFFRANV